MNFLRSLLKLMLFVEAIFIFCLADNEFIQNQQQFATHFYSNLNKQNAGKSIIFSPFSLQSCFSMLYMGTKGTAANELERGFHLGSSEREVISNNFKKILDEYKDNKQLKTYNKIYVDNHSTLVPKFKEVATENFHSEAETVDLTKGQESASIVNNWINEKTNGKIEKLIEDSDCNANTRLILLNAIYFKGNWQHPFDKSSTKKQDFWTSETNSIQVDMMNLVNNLKMKKIPKLKANVVELPYADSTLSMVLVIPTKKEGLSNLESEFQNTNFEDLFNDLHERQVKLFMPKFKVETTIDLKDILPRMGIEKIYNDPDFTDLADGPLKLVKAVHKAVVEVSEEGTEAAAATGTVINTRTGPFPLAADRPFLFIIKDNAGRNFFMGRFTGA